MAQLRKSNDGSPRSLPIVQNIGDHQEGFPGNLAGELNGSAFLSVWIAGTLAENADVILPLSLLLLF